MAKPAGARLAEILTRALERRRLLVALPAALFVLVVGTGLIAPFRYTVSASFVPARSSSGLRGIAGLAAQFGVTLPDAGSDPSRSPDFYAELLRSRQLLRALVEAEYRYEADGDSVHATLIEIYRIDEPTPAQSRELAVKRLGQALTVSTSLRTGVVSFSVRAPHPAVALQIAERALSLLNTFNVETRRSEAGAERQFVESRLDEARTALRQAEDRLQAFLQANREFRSSPQLTFQNDRLQRAVDLQQQVVLGLAQSYEQARLQEVRDTPVITVVEQPILPARRDTRLLLVKGLFAIFTGLVLAAFIVIAGDEARRAEAADPAVTARLGRLWRETRSDLWRPWRLFTRRRTAADT